MLKSSVGCNPITQTTRSYQHSFVPLGCVSFTLTLHTLYNSTLSVFSVQSTGDNGGKQPPRDDGSDKRQTDESDSDEDDESTLPNPVINVNVPVGELGPWVLTGMAWVGGGLAFVGVGLVVLGAGLVFGDNKGATTVSNKMKESAESLEHGMSKSAEKIERGMNKSAEAIQRGMVQSADRVANKMNQATPKTA